jgi:hypothetical protein
VIRKELFECWVYNDEEKNKFQLKNLKAQNEIKKKVCGLSGTI